MDEPITNINEVLNLIHIANKKLEQEFTVPSTGEKILLKPLTALHTKDITKSSVDGNFIQNQFNIEFFKILHNIIVGDKEVVHRINTVDKIALILFLRMHNISKRIKVSYSSDNSDENQETFEMDIEKILSKFYKNKKEFKSILTNDDYSIVLDLPTVSEEYIFDTSLHANHISKFDRNKQDNAKNMIGTLFLYTLASYIKELLLPTSHVPLKQMSVDSRIKIVENLSADKITKVLETIDKDYGERISELLTVETKNKKGKIEITPLLLLAS